MHERGREVEPALHAARVRADRLPSASPMSMSALSSATRWSASPRVQAVQPPLQAQQLGAGLLRVERGVLEGDADAQAHLSGSRATSYPATLARPPVGASSVHSTRTVVDLPAPFGPRKP